MEEKQVSGTALMAAYLRAYHAANDNPKIFNDFLAHQLLTEEVRNILEQHLSKYIQAIDPAKAALYSDFSNKLMWSVRAMAGNFLSRARYTEDCLEEAISHGIQQYVILGAGLDTFAYRRPDLLEHLQVFEVDHPATQHAKRTRLLELGWEQPEQVHYISADFNKDNLMQVLKNSAFDSNKPSFFSWLGVTQYLSRETGFETLRSIAGASAAGSIIIFDYYDTDAFDPEKAAKRVQVIRKSTRDIGEPINNGFNPAALADDLIPLGLHLLENMNPAEIQKLYFQARTDGYYASEHVHYARAAVE